MNYDEFCQYMETDDFKALLLVSHDHIYSALRGEGVSRISIFNAYGEAELPAGIDSFSLQLGLMLGMFIVHMIPFNEELTTEGDTNAAPDQS